VVSVAEKKIKEFNERKIEKVSKERCKQRFSKETETQK
jgi:hypothetical protein